ncbi:MAG: hypothetical protein AAF441_29835 [Pseudomonadota bacterium]
MPREAWNIHEQANVLYTAFPSNQFFLMQDHVAWVSLEPLDEDRTRVRLATLAPAVEITPDNADHGKRNHGITMMSLGKDFDINEAVQAGIQDGIDR